MRLRVVLVIFLSFPRQLFSNLQGDNSQPCKNSLLQQFLSLWFQHSFIVIACIINYIYSTLIIWHSSVKRDLSFLVFFSFLCFLVSLINSQINQNNESSFGSVPSLISFSMILLVFQHFFASGIITIHLFYSIMVFRNQGLCTLCFFLIATKLSSILELCHGYKNFAMVLLIKSLS